MAIASLDEFDRLVLPDPATSPVLVEALKTTRIVAREVGEHGFVMGIAD